MSCLIITVFFFCVDKYEILNNLKYQKSAGKIQEFFSNKLNKQKKRMERELHKKKIHTDSYRFLFFDNILSIELQYIIYITYIPRRQHDLMTTNFSGK